MEKYHHFTTKHRVGSVIGMVIGGFIFGMFLAFFFGLIVMWLWNWLMPVIFGLPAITYWQAWGLVLLSHILFKSFPHHRTNHHHRFPPFRHDEEWKEKMRQRYRDYKRWSAEQEAKKDETTEKE